MDFFDDEIEQREALLDAWVEVRREIAVLEARASDLLSDRLRVHEADVRSDGFHRDVMYRSMLAEYSAAGRIAQGTLDRAFVDARFLGLEFPELKASFNRGRVTAAHVHEVIEAGLVVSEAVSTGRADVDVLRLYEVAAVVAAEADTPGRTKVQARAIASALVGETIKDRHRRAKSERTVSVKSVGDGLALLQMVLPEYLAVAIFDRLTQLARHVISARDETEPVLDVDVLDDGEAPIYPEDLDPTDPRLDDLVIFGESDTFTSDPLADDASPDLEHPPTDSRGIDEVRADLASDLLLGASLATVSGTDVENIRGRVQVTIAASTVAGADDRLAELDGYGPIDPDFARDLAGESGLWSRLFLDPTGLLVETDAYRPTAAMKRFLRARDPHCRFPGCRMPVHRCEFDHNHDHALGGKTRLDNLSAFCRGHHTLKHPDLDDRYRWRARQLPAGEVQWTSPLGRSYEDLPLRRVMFA